MTVNLAAAAVAALKARGNAVGNVRGWKTAVARELGVDQSYVSLLLSGKRQPGIDLVQRILGNSHVSAEHGDPETAAMATLSALPSDARSRVLRWAADRWATDTWTDTTSR